MIIRNFSELATSKKRQHCLEILEAGLAAADPAGIIPKFVTRHGIKAGQAMINPADYAGIHTVAFGKAADSMTKAVDAAIPVSGGIIAMPRGARSVIRKRKFQIFNSGHPEPDRTSVKAAKQVVKFLKNRQESELVIFLVSGGASAMLALPDGITLHDKIRITRLLLRSGATIQEFNCIRKHLSKVKGGRLVSGLKCQAVSLVMSDVEADDLSAIASGTTFKDSTTFKDALDIVAKYNLGKKIPQHALQALQDGLDGKRPETPKKAAIPNQVVASNALCLAAMQKKAEQAGYASSTMQVFGDIKQATSRLVKNIPEKKKSCLIFGGETAVKVLGNGTGGRNHELVLRILKNTQKKDKLVIASVGTDGIDGSTKFAGAITENARTDPQTIKKFLRESDSGTFFQRRGLSIMTGFTHTNLMDIGVILL